MACSNKIPGQYFDPPISEREEGSEKETGLMIGRVVLHAR